jgi:hypothetical protein
MGQIEQLALITEALEQFAPNSKIIVAFELDKKTFGEFSKKLNENLGNETDRFSVDISGTKFYFVSEGAE